MAKLAEELTFHRLKTPKFINYLTGIKPNTTKQCLKDGQGEPPYTYHLGGDRVPFSDKAFRFVLVLR